MRGERANRCLVLLILFSLVGVALAQTELDRQVFNLSRQLRCPVCTSESVADSNADVSIEMRNIVQEQLEAGKSEAEVLAYFQARYGDWILLEPPKRGLHLLVWLLPVVVAVAGALALALLVRRWTQVSREPLEADEADLKRVREALEQGAS